MRGITLIFVATLGGGCLASYIPPRKLPSECRAPFALSGLLRPETLADKQRIRSTMRRAMGRAAGAVGSIFVSGWLPQLPVFADDPPPLPPDAMPMEFAIIVGVLPLMPTVFD